jgi:asparagine synthase (glutamine-hydrolysing)
MKDINMTDYDYIVRALEEAVKRRPVKGMLLSGGLDTSILAATAARWSKPYCVTAAYTKAPAPDVEYAGQVARLFGLRHYVHYFGDDEIEEGLYKAVTVLKSFDPMEIRNSAAAYIALKAAREKGLTSVMTGDGSDELFAGYSFFFDLSKDELDAALRRMQADMSFSAVDLAEDLGIQVIMPLLDPDFQDLARKIDSKLKVNYEKGQLWGKWILRKAFENILPPEIIWRVKAPLEEGTGTAVLPLLFDAGISNADYCRKRNRFLMEDGVRIRSKEHLHYYEIYRREVGIPCFGISKERICPACRANIKEETNFCRTCGEYPV